MSSSTTTTPTIGDKTFQGVGDLIKLLPTGTVFLFQFLSPILTNNGDCSLTYKILTGILLFVCGFNCCFSSFTDSYAGADGKVYYGIVTINGMWTFSTDPNAANVDLTGFKLRLGDFVHASFSLLVFAVIGLLDSDTVLCFYPSFQSTGTAVLSALPVAVGGGAGLLFTLFPNDRHGIGYPSSSSSSSSTTTTTTNSSSV